LSFTLSSVGIQARGRSTILRVNYRNTDEIFKFAYRFVHHYLKPKLTDEDQAPVIEPQAAGRHGLNPQIRYFDSFDLEISTLVRWLQRWHSERGMSWSQMAILYRDTEIGRCYFDALKKAKIPCDWVANKAAKKAFNPHNNTVKLMTMHSSKGLEFPLIIIAGLGFMPSADQDELNEAKLLYVAMTRATEKLVLATHQMTAFTQLFPKPQTST
jgi:superfamily I DNA/RNA helicase